MHLLEALIIVENSDSEWFQNIIVNIFDVVLEYTPMLLQHALSQFEINLRLEVDALVQPQVRNPVIIKTIFLRPRPQ